MIRGNFRFQIWVVPRQARPFADKLVFLLIYPLREFQQRLPVFFGTCVKKSDKLSYCIANVQFYNLKETINSEDKRNSSTRKNRIPNARQLT